MPGFNNPQNTCVVDICMHWGLIGPNGPLKLHVFFCVFSHCDYLEALLTFKTRSCYCVLTLGLAKTRVRFACLDNSPHRHMQKHKCAFWQPWAPHGPMQLQRPLEEIIFVPPLHFLQIFCRGPQSILLGNRGPWIFFKYFVAVIGLLCLGRGTLACSSNMTCCRGPQYLLLGNRDPCIFFKYFVGVLGLCFWGLGTPAFSSNILPGSPASTFSYLGPNHFLQLIYRGPRLCLWGRYDMIIYIYIYTYRERERERER